MLILGTLLTLAAGTWLGWTAREAYEVTSPESLQRVLSGKNAEHLRQPAGRRYSTHPLRRDA